MLRDLLEWFLALAELAFYEALCRVRGHSWVEAGGCRWCKRCMTHDPRRLP